LALPVCFDYLQFDSSQIDIIRPKYMSSRLRQIIDVVFSTAFVLPLEIIKIIAEEYLLKIKQKSIVDVEHTIEHGITLIDNNIYFFKEHTHCQLYGYSFDMTSGSLCFEDTSNKLNTSVNIVRTKIMDRDIPVIARCVNFFNTKNPLLFEEYGYGVTHFDDKIALYGISSSLEYDLTFYCNYYLAMSQKLKIIFSQTYEKKYGVRSTVIFMHDLFEIKNCSQKIDEEKNRIIRLGSNANCINCTIIEDSNQVLFVTNERIIFCTIDPFHEVKILDFNEKQILAACSNDEYLFVLVSKLKKKSEEESKEDTKEYSGQIELPDLWINVYELNSFKNCSEIKSLNNVLCDSIQISILTTFPQYASAIKNITNYLMSANDHALVMANGVEFMIYDINDDKLKK
jgi:hypothetical protein